MNTVNTLNTLSTDLPPVEWPHRSEVGKFCMYNCFQEALAPVLKADFGIDGQTFDRLRFIGLTDIAGPIADRRDPGGFGGLGWPRLREIYKLRWRWLRKVGRDRPEAVWKLAQQGPLIAVVDRYLMPTDKAGYRRHHRMHTILIVAADADGIAYTDVEYPFNAPRVSWEDFGRALLPAEDRRLQPGPDQKNSFVVLVEEATDPADAVKEQIRAGFLDSVAAGLAHETGRIEEVRKLIMDGLAEVDQEAGLLRGHDLGAFLNGAARSLQVASELVTERTGDGSDASAYFTGLWKQTDSASRLLQMYVESGRDRYLARVDRELEKAVTAWDAADRKAVAAQIRGEAA